jgi:hypothetical protein
MLGPIPQLIHNKSVANSVLLAICYELATIKVVANPRFSCSGGRKSMLICHIVRNISWTHISHRIMHARFCPFLVDWLLNCKLAGKLRHWKGLRDSLHLLFFLDWFLNFYGTFCWDQIHWVMFNINQKNWSKATYTWENP